MDKREFNSLQSRDYVGISDKGNTTYMNIWTKMTNKKQKSRTVVTDITNKYFRKLLKKLNNLLYLGYKKKLVHKEPTES